MVEIQPVLFLAKTEDGPEYVAAYPIGELVVHRALFNQKWAVSHAATGYCLQFETSKKEDAIRAAGIVNDATDWSILRLGDDGTPEWNGNKPILAKAAKAGLDFVMSLN